MLKGMVVTLAAAATLAAPAASAAPNQTAALNARVTALEKRANHQAAEITQLQKQLKATASLTLYNSYFSVCTFKITVDLFNVVFPVVGLEALPPVDDKGACAAIGVGTRALFGLPSLRESINKLGRSQPASLPGARWTTWRELRP